MKVKLESLLRHVTPVALTGRSDVETIGLQLDSRELLPGETFVALRGLNFDGHRFIDAAIQRGAAAVVCETPAPPDIDVTWVQVRNSRSALARMATALHDAPADDLSVVGVTGTNGKTTVCYLLESILRADGRVTGILGTVSVRYAGQEHRAALTTPEAVNLQRVLADMRDAGVTDVAMEVSSHAVDLRRIEGCAFTVGVFTNLSRDHLDFHGDLRRYAEAKARFLVEDVPAGGRARGLAINLADATGREIAERASLPVMGFSAESKADVWARDLESTVDGLSMTVQTPRGELEVTSPLPGRHNGENILAAIAAAEILEVPHEAVVAGVLDLKHVPGRLERVESAVGISVFVDYAHTDDALDNVAGALRPLTTGRLVTVFGCGGDRDRTKRPAMAAAAARHSDVVIVTSDNPRTEEPDAIIADILPGLGDSPRLAASELAGAIEGAFVEPDRRKAIEVAIAAARPGDTVLIAGKGHEDYQIVGTTRHHFDDREIARAALGSRSDTGSGPKG